jgi:hypothetical protein
LRSACGFTLRVAGLPAPGSFGTNAIVTLLLS